MTKRITPALLREAANVARKNRKSLVGCSYPVCKAIFGEVDVLDYEYAADALAAALTATADTMELDYLPQPVGVDGETVRVGDEVFVDADGPFVVEGLLLGSYGGWDVLYETDDSSYRASVAHVSHTPTDSWESIIDDAYALGMWAVEMVGDGPDYSTDDLVERCRRLAGESR